MFQKIHTRKIELPPRENRDDKTQRILLESPFFIIGYDFGAILPTNKKQHAFAERNV